MKKYTVHLLIPLLVFFSYCNAQSPKKEKVKMNKEVRKLVNLGKDAIIQQALTALDKKASLTTFSTNSVQTNGKEVYVVFSNPVLYLPQNSIFKYTMGVHLMTGALFSNTIANPEDFRPTTAIPIYQETATATEHIAFVVEAIPNLNASDLTNFEGSLIIREKEDHYAVRVVSEIQESWYKIKKDTGTMYDEGHAHLEPQPFSEEDPETFKEIAFNTKNE
ncbi:hypothetical protein [Cellulophaga sp. HaHa_2_1]|uniref:hypothetical protein n=1 Tax=Cellulophaga sp. HaHa_2_1 TaxID=2749994 RepID=UPI001C4E9246|nr:hypothetical protein [Cellulophaga sp. HaHa_2_1]QXP53572.1 hypothetical protein H0I24_06475 [Cellulophaga sp. HaHa_2_1]